MLELLKAIHDRDGYLALGIAVAAIALGWLVRALWNSNQSVNREYRAAVEREREAAKKTTEDFATRFVEQQNQFSDRLAKMQSEHTAKIEALQERRLNESRAQNEQILKALQEVDATSASFKTVLDAILGALREARR